MSQGRTATFRLRSSGARYSNFDLVTARGFHDCKLDLGTFDSGDFTSHFASLMRGMRKLEAENLAPKCERPLKIRDRDACVVGGKNAKLRPLGRAHARDCNRK